MVGVAERRGAAHDVALHVAAGGDGGEQRLVDAGDGGLEVALEHAVELEALAGGHPEGAVGVVVGEPLEPEVLLGRDGAGRDRDPHHEGVGLLEPGGLERPPGVAVVLLVGAVELEQMGIVLAEVRPLRRQRLGDGAAQVPPAALGDFDFGFRLSGHRWAHTFLASCPVSAKCNPHSDLSVPGQRPLRV